MSFKYDILGKVRFGNELEDISKLKGIKDINSFLNPTIKNTESELLFDNIEKARDVFIKHIRNKDVIDLLVDCDVDGFTSASNIYQYIKRLNPDIEVRCFIHKGKIHGYLNLWIVCVKMIQSLLLFQMQVQEILRSVKNL